MTSLERLCCPACRGTLSPRPGGVACGACGCQYPAVGPILDLRVPGASWIDYPEDRARALRLLALGPEVPVPLLFQEVFGRRPGWSEEQSANRTRQALMGVARLRGEVTSWLRPMLDGPGPVLDLGCGAGQLAAALMLEGQDVIGLDVSLEWLVVADRLVFAEAGRRPQLVAALAEALPFGDGMIGAVMSLDVIEHVGDQPGYLREINRVLSPGGHAAFTTPNRFSLAAEPHVGVWGVGWLPRSRQKAYVAWRSSLPYDYVRLLSSPELGRMLRRETELVATVTPAPIPAEDIQRMDRRRAVLARIYNALLGVFLTRWLFRAIGPFFRVLGRKRGGLTG